MPAKAGIQVRHSAHGREEAMNAHDEKAHSPTPRRYRHVRSHPLRRSREDGNLASLSSVMPAKAGIQVRHSAHRREEAMMRTMRRPTPQRLADYGQRTRPRDAALASESLSAEDSAPLLHIGLSRSYRLGIGSRPICIRPMPAIIPVTRSLLSPCRDCSAGMPPDVVAVPSVMDSVRWFFTAVRNFFSLVIRLSE